MGGEDRGESSLLLVEDDRSLARGIQRRMNGLRCTIEHIDRGSEALDRVRRGPAARVVWCDCELDGFIDGVDVLGLASSCWPRAVLMLVTSDPSGQRAKRAPTHALLFDKTELGVAFKCVETFVGRR